MPDWQGKGREWFEVLYARDANISCLIHLKIKAKDVCMPVMPIKDDVAHNYEHAQSHTHINTYMFKHVYR